MHPGAIDLHLLGEGTHERLHEALGAHPEPGGGVRFAVWAPNAAAVGVGGDWNEWDPAADPLTCLGDSGVWSGCMSAAAPGDRYKFAIRTRDGRLHWKADPFARRTEPPPATASVVEPTLGPSSPRERHTRNGAEPHLRPLSIYEVHLGSWRRHLGDNRPYTYRELAAVLPVYVEALGFTHVELMPVMEHPFGGSWGYQVGAYFAPTARFGTPDDFRALVAAFHARGIGVILDWVPAHFPGDAHALARFDGTALFEHADDREGQHPHWGTLVFNYGRREVRSFLIANALYWIDRFGVDGLRIDAVASMLYRNYGRRDGDWIPNRHGGPENLEAVAFLQDLNARVHARHPGVLTIAEESTAWPGVSRPVDAGGLGFGFKWNLGWMHDTLDYFGRDPVHRRHHHDRLTFGLLYAWSENYVLPLSHDEVVHGKGSLLGKMHGDPAGRLAGLRALYAWMWAHPGKKLLFMGGEFAQEREWDHDRELDWGLLQRPGHAGVQRLLADLNRLYREEPALFEADGSPDGFRWLVVDDADANVLAFLRRSPSTGREIACIANLSPISRPGYRLPLPRAGTWREILNTDSRHYGGGDAGNTGAVRADPVPARGLPATATLTLPGNAVLWLAPG